MQPLAAQIEETIRQPDFFRIFLVAEHRHRQFAGGTQHFDLGDVDLDGAGRQVGVLGAGGALAHVAVDPHHPLRAQLLRVLEGRRVRIGYHLSDAVMVAQVDEQQATMIADTMAPAGEPDLFADVAFAQRAAGVGAVAMHDDERASILVARKGTCAASLVKDGKAMMVLDVRTA